MRAWGDIKKEVNGKAKTSFFKSIDENSNGISRLELESTTNEDSQTGVTIMTNPRRDLKKIGQRFKLFRTLIRESLDNLAVVLCVDRSVLEKVESGAQTSLIIVCKRAFEEYGLSPNWIYTGSGSVFKTWTKRTPLDAFTAANFSNVEDPHFFTIAQMVHCMFADPGCRGFILQKFQEFAKDKGIPVQWDIETIALQNQEE